MHIVLTWIVASMSYMKEVESMQPIIGAMHAVDAVANSELLLVRLDVDIGGPALDRAAALQGLADTQSAYAWAP